MESRNLLAVITVNTPADTIDNRANVTSLREAIAQANAAPGDDVIKLSVNGTISLKQALPSLSSNISIQGPGSSSLTVRRDTGRYSIFTIAAATNVNISGLTIANGNAAHGGGIHNSGTLNVQSSVFSNNSTNGNGGAITNFGALTVDFTTFANNSASNSGGAIDNRGSLTVNYSTFANNSASFGGGVYNSDTLTVANSTFSNNTASFYGGGINNGGSVSVNHSTFADNVAALSGGGINNGGSLTVNHSTFAKNSASNNFGGGINNGGSLTLKNTIVADSVSKPDLTNSGTISGENNLIESGANIGSLVGTITADPKLGPLADNGGPTQTFALLPGSPAINRGKNALIPTGVTTDQRGVGYARIVGGIVDIGAYEFSPTRSYVDYVVDTANDVDNGNYAPGDLSLREAIKFANVNVLIPSQIDFAFSTAKTVNLNSALPALAGNITINGPGASLLTVRRDAGGDYGVFTVSAGAVVSLSGLTIANGKAVQGGGIGNFGSLTVSNSTFADNSASDGGGGIFNYKATLTVNNSTLVNNSASYGGGGIYNYQATLTVNSSTFADNSTLAAGSDPGFGGGINNEYSKLTVNNSTFSNNSSGGGGGAIDNYKSTLNLNNTILANSVLGQDLMNSYSTISGENNLIESGANIGSLVGTITADPKLGPLADNGGPTQTFALLPGSPAINRGKNALIPTGVTTDQRGVGYARIAGGTVDIGSYEVQTASSSFRAESAVVAEPVAAVAPARVSNAILSLGAADSSSLNFSGGDQLKEMDYDYVSMFAALISSDDDAAQDGLTGVPKRVRRRVS